MTFVLKFFSNSISYYVTLTAVGVRTSYSYRGLRPLLPISTPQVRSVSQTTRSSNTHPSATLIPPYLTDSKVQTGLGPPLTALAYQLLLIPSRMPTTIFLDSTNPALSHLSPRDKELFCAYGMGPESLPTHVTMLAALEDAARKHPQNLAAQQVLPDGSVTGGITYSQLSRRSDTLAALLRAHGITNCDAVPLFIKRSIDMIIAIFAILKVGACYVPQDARLAPAEQLARIASATDARVILTMSQFIDKLPDFPHAKVISIDEILAKTEDLTFEGAERVVRPDDRCYIIFTSGTTGAPKGVQVTHGNVANVLLTDPMSLGMRPGLRVSQILSVAFDMGAWEILGCLSHGATLVIRDRKIADAVAHADIVIATPTVLGTIDSSQMQHVQAVAVAGEPCPRPLAEEWGKFCQFYNSCGPTEVTIINTAKLFDAEAEILSIGKPTPNNTVYVLDAQTRKPCKIGEVGEMWGGGLCVSQGYLNNETLTKERYLPDPFAQGGRMYRTGDLGRWNEDGELEHFGRVDDQVKVKGFRVELDGVSACAEKAEGVQKAVVVKVDDYLVAFVTPLGVDEKKVKESIQGRLPYYCVPKKVICMNELPKTGNGKVDKRGLVKSLKEAMTEAEKTTIVEGDRSTTKPWVGLSGLRRILVTVMGA